MPNYSYYGVPSFVGPDVASTAIEDTTNSKILDAAAGHVWQVATATTNEQLWLTVNAVSPTASTATYKAAQPAAAISINAQGVLQIYNAVTGTAGGSITWIPVLAVSPTGPGAAVVSMTSLFVSGPVTMTSAFVSGPVTMTSASVSGPVTATSAYISGTVTATVSVAVGVTPSQTGLVRLPYASGGISFRNQAGSGDHQAIEVTTIGSTNVVAVGTDNTVQGVAIGTGGIAANATFGFPYIPAMGATPTGTPGAVTGFVPIVLDTTHNALWIYNSGWKTVTLT